MMIPTTKPPLFYNILKSIAKEHNLKYTSIYELPELVAPFVFNFDYTLSNVIDKSEFEERIISHFISRRIGAETFTMFQFFLRSKIREIMPYYNKLFNAFNDWDIFADAEKIRHDVTIDRDETSKDHNENTFENSSKIDSNSTGQSKIDNRESDTPQSEIDDVKSGKYLSRAQFNVNDTTSKDSSNAKNNGSAKNDSNGERKSKDVHVDVMTRDVSNKIEVYKAFKNEVESIYTEIFKDLDVLFYGLI